MSKDSGDRQQHSSVRDIMFGKEGLAPKHSVRRKEFDGRGRKSEDLLKSTLQRRGHHHEHKIMQQMGGDGVVRFEPRSLTQTAISPNRIMMDPLDIRIVQISPSMLSNNGGQSRQVVTVNVANQNGGSGQTQITVPIQQASSSLGSTITGNLGSSNSSSTVTQKNLTNGQIVLQDINSSIDLGANDHTGLTPIPGHGKQSKRFWIDNKEFDGIAVTPNHTIQCHPIPLRVTALDNAGGIPPAGMIPVRTMDGGMEEIRYISTEAVYKQQEPARKRGASGGPKRVAKKQPKMEHMKAPIATTVDFVTRHGGHPMDYHNSIVTTQSFPVATSECTSSMGSPTYIKQEHFMDDGSHSPGSSVGGERGKKTPRRYTRSADHGTGIMKREDYQLRRKEQNKRAQANMRARKKAELETAQGEIQLLKVKLDTAVTKNDEHEKYIKNLHYLIEQHAIHCAEFPKSQFPNIWNHRGQKKLPVLVMPDQGPSTSGTVIISGNNVQQVTTSVPSKVFERQISLSSQFPTPSSLNHISTPLLEPLMTPNTEQIVLREMDLANAQFIQELPFQHAISTLSKPMNHQGKEPIVVETHVIDDETYAARVLAQQHRRSLAEELKPQFEGAHIEPLPDSQTASNTASSVDEISPRSRFVTVVEEISPGRRYATVDGKDLIPITTRVVDGVQVNIVQEIHEAMDNHSQAIIEELPKDDLPEVKEEMKLDYTDTPTSSSSASASSSSVKSPKSIGQKPKSRPKPIPSKLNLESISSITPTESVEPSPTRRSGRLHADLDTPTMLDNMIKSIDGKLTDDVKVKRGVFVQRPIAKGTLSKFKEPISLSTPSDVKLTTPSSRAQRTRTQFSFDANEKSKPTELSEDEDGDQEDSMNGS